jgi:hypothetical protein
MVDRTVTMRPEDLEHAEEAWRIYKHEMRNHPRRQLRKRELIAGFLGGVMHERAHQQLNVHPNIMRIQQLVDFAEHDPEGFARMKRENPEAVAKVRSWLEGDS